MKGWISRKGKSREMPTEKDGSLKIGKRGKCSKI